MTGGWAATNTLREGIVYSCDPISEAIGEGCGECAGCESYAALALVETALDAAQELLDDQGWTLDEGCDCTSCALAAALRAVREGA